MQNHILFQTGFDERSFALTVRVEKDPSMPARSIGIHPGVPIILAVFLLLYACSKDPAAPADTTPPATVTDLIAINPTSSSIMLTWTAPGDDGRAGTASRYDIRYSQFPLTTEIWPSANQASGEPSPRPAGSADTFVVTGLAPSTLYYFSLKTADEAGNWSGKSIIASAPTTAAARATSR
jgi:hypothetical protein